MQPVQSAESLLMHDYAALTALLMVRQQGRASNSAQVSHSPMKPALSQLRTAGAHRLTCAAVSGVPAADHTPVWLPAAASCNQ
jgi:hypothetical protein